MGLALLRLEHVDLAERGLLKFQIDDKWALKSWKPDWWPSESK